MFLTTNAFISDIWQLTLDRTLAAPVLTHSSMKIRSRRKQTKLP